MIIRFLVILSLVGCSTINRSVLVGAGSGTVIGAVSGVYLNPHSRGMPALYSGLSMGLVGGFLGYLSHKELEKRDERVRKKTLSDLKKNRVLIHEGKNRYYDFGEKREVFIITDDPRFLRKLQ